VTIDPRAPTHHPPGSPGKIRVLEARACAKLPLFVEGDVQGARKLTDAQLATSRHSPIERRIVQVIPLFAPHVRGAGG
jgi:hypothetical protein